MSLPGLTPDSWINHLYAMDLASKGQRGFVLTHQMQFLVSCDPMVWFERRTLCNRESFEQHTLHSSNRRFSFGVDELGPLQKNLHP